jgi:hypothetical protein
VGALPEELTQHLARFAHHVRIAGVSGAVERASEACLGLVDHAGGSRLDEATGEHLERGD